MQKFLRFGIAALATVALLAVTLVLDGCQSVPIEAVTEWDVGRGKYRISGHFGIGDVSIDEPTDLPMDVSFTDADGNPVGPTTSVVTPTSLTIPEGATMMHLGKSTGRGGGGEGARSGGAAGGGMFQIGDARGTATQSLAATSDGMNSTVNWQIGWPLAAGGYLYYVELEPDAVAHNFESVYAVMRPILEGGPDAAVPSYVDIQTLVQTTLHPDESFSVRFCERSPFTSFELGLNDSSSYATLESGSSVTDHGNGWHSVTVNVPFEDLHDAVPRAFNTSRMAWSTEADSEAQETFEAWVISSNE